MYEQGAVWVDTVNGASGSVAWVNGFSSFPTNTFANAETIAVGLPAGLETFRVISGSTITLDVDLGNRGLFGENWTLALNGKKIDGCTITGATVSGVSVDNSIAKPTFRNCSFSSLTVKPCTIDDSDFSTGQTLTVLTAGTYAIHHCMGHGAGYTFDFAAVGATTFNIGDWDGPIIVKNMAAGDILNLAGRGTLTIDSTCTAGTVTVVGAFDVTNNGSGQTVTQTASVGTVNTTANSISAVKTQTDKLTFDASNNIKVASNVKKNQALLKFQFGMTDSTNHAPATLKTVTCTRSIDGGAFAAGTLANVTEVSDGDYVVDFGAGDLNGNVIVLKATASGCDVTLERIVTDP
jgi:hypothetical protein